MGPLVSLVADSAFIRVTDYRNRPNNDGLGYIYRIEAEFSYVAVAIGAAIETIARVIILPIASLPLFTQSPPQRELFFHRVVAPLSNGILHNGSIVLFSLIALALNPLPGNLDFTRIGKELFLIRRTPEA